MKLKNKKGQALVQYFLIALVVLGLIYALVPLFREANKTLTDSAAPEANQKLNKEGIITTPALVPGTVTPSVPATPPPAPPSTPGPPPPAPAVGNCGPNGCGTRDLTAAELACGTIPGPAGVLEEGCWICNTSTGFWYWETDTATNCPNYWYDGLGSTCSTRCNHYSPPQKGTFGSGKMCYICISSGPSEGKWAYWHDHTNNDCVKFWNSPYDCFGSVDAHYDPTCGPSACPGAPPLYGWYLEKTTGQMSCWVCDDGAGKWVNTIDAGSTDYCKNYWKTDSPSCVNYNAATTASEEDFPFCGCITEPPARGPDLSGTGECWMCYNGVWVKETDPAKCADFWVNDNCPATSSSGLTCLNSLPGTSPGAGNCWLCTNPSEIYRINPIDTSNPMYTGYGQPCDSFWTYLKYPGYLNIPGSPDNVDTVCKNALPDTDGSKRPGIIYNAAASQWGCWLCADINNDGFADTNYNWVYWQGARFDHWTEDQYQACHKFWIDGIYPNAIPVLPLEYERYYEYGGAGYESGYDLVEDGGYLYLVGYESSDSGGGNTDIAVIKMNKNDNVINWKKQYGGNKEEKGRAIDVLGSDIYLTGYEVSDPAGGNYDIVVMKLNTSGAVQWKNQYGGTGDDKGNDIAVGDGIYVTGSETSDIDGGEEDIFVMKLNSSGTLLWKKQYGGTGEDIGQSIVFADNSVFVTGYEMSDSDGGLSDVFVMKLDTNGNTIWQKQYGGVNTDRAYSIVYLNSFLYVTGYEMSDSNGGYADIFVMKLDNNGNVVWKKQYGGSGNDKAYAIHVYDNYLYVTGEENSDPQAGANYIGGSLGKKDLFIMRLDPADGSVIWKQQHGGVNDEKGLGIASAYGYIYIIGEEASDTDGGANDLTVLSLHAEQDPNLASADPDDNRNIDDWTENGSNLSWSANGVLIDEWTVVSDGITSGTTEGWTVEGNITGWTVLADAITDGAGAWELEGSVIDPETGTTPPHEEEINWTPIVSAKTPAPAPLPPPVVEWQHQYGGALNDIGRAIVVNGADIYVAGQTSTGASLGALTDALVMKIDNDGPDNIYGTSDDGTISWKKRYGRSTHEDIICSMVFDGTSLYVTGFRDTGSYNEYDAFVMKLDTNGNVQWAKDYGGNKDDYGFSIAEQGSYIYVYGIENDSFSGGGDIDKFIMKLKKADGTVEWAKQYGGDDDDFFDNLPDTASWQELYNQAQNLLVSEDGYIYLASEERSDTQPYTGSQEDIAVLKLNESDGSRQWAKQIGGNYEDVAFSIAGDEAGNIYICGEEESDHPNSGSDDVFVIKMNSNGNILWKKQFGGYGDEDVPLAIVYESGNLYITGLEDSDPNGGNYDIFIMKLDTDGNVAWKKQFGGYGNEVGMAIDVNSDNIYVTGFETSDSNGGRDDIVVIKLDANHSSTPNLNWPTDEVFDTPLNHDIDTGNHSQKWRVFADDITGKPGWHASVSSWTYYGNNITTWTLEGTTIDNEVIDGWSVGL